MLPSPKRALKKELRVQRVLNSFCQDQASKHCVSLSFGFLLPHVPCLGMSMPCTDVTRRTSCLAPRRCQMQV